MADVAEIAGEAVARELCDKLPGIVVYVPQTIPEKHALRAMDPDRAADLVRHFAGGSLYVPSPRKTYKDTFEQVEVLRADGLTVQQIALRLGITEQQVYAVRRKAGAPRITKEPDPRQLPLFNDKD